jgi:hypothetical protein
MVIVSVFKPDLFGWFRHRVEVRKNKGYQDELGSKIIQ